MWIKSPSVANQIVCSVLTLFQRSPLLVETTRDPNLPLFDFISLVPRWSEPRSKIWPFRVLVARVPLLRRDCSTRMAKLRSLVDVSLDHLRFVRSNFSKRLPIYWFEKCPSYGRVLLLINYSNWFTNFSVLLFFRLVKQILEDMAPFKTPFRWQANAIEALQEVAESYLINLFEYSNIVAHNAKRCTVMLRDMQVVRRIRSFDDIANR